MQPHLDKRMIFAGVYVNTTTYRETFPHFGARNKVAVNEWQLIKDVLENTGDTFIYIITSVQLYNWLHTIKEQGLEKYLIVDERNGGTTNRNNMADDRRLKVFVFKGAKHED